MADKVRGSSCDIMGSAGYADKHAFSFIFWNDYTGQVLSGLKYEICFK